MLVFNNVLDLMVFFEEHNLLDGKTVIVTLIYLISCKSIGSVTLQEMKKSLESQNYSIFFRSSPLVQFMEEFCSYWKIELKEFDKTASFVARIYICQFYLEGLRQDDVFLQSYSQCILNAVESMEQVMR